MSLEFEKLYEIKAAIEEARKQNIKVAEALEERLSQIERSFMEQHYLNKVERLCDNLKAAILRHTLFYPDIVEFEQALSMLTSAKSVSFIMERLRRIKMLTDPGLMFDKQIRKTASDEEILDACLSNYSEDKTISIKSLDKNELTPLLNRHFIEMKMDYGSYFAELVRISQKIALNHRLSIDGNFAVIQTLFHTQYSSEKVEAVFDVIVKKNYIVGGVEEKATFLSMFDCSIVTAEKKINIIKTGKNKKPTVSWLYVLFTMLLEKESLTLDEKMKISAFFLANDEPIEATSIKPREGSNELETFKTALATILSS